LGKRKRREGCPGDKKGHLLGRKKSAKLSLGEEKKAKFSCHAIVGEKEKKGRGKAGIQLCLVIVNRGSDGATADGLKKKRVRNCSHDAAKERKNSIAAEDAKGGKK